MTVAAKQGRKVLIACVSVALALTACVVEQPVIESTTGDTPPTTAPTNGPEPTAVPPQFEPTAEVVVPTATPVPTPLPTATPVPPTPAPPAGPTPLPTTAPTDEFAPVTVEAGLVVVPVHNVSFRLSAAHQALQLGGHTLIYVDDERTAEVDIFTPVAKRDGEPFNSYNELMNFMTTDSAFDNLLELTPVSIAGLRTRVFEGPSTSTERAFVTDLAFADDDQFGWLPPARMRLWVVDHPDGAIIISAESLENPGRYSDAVRLATEILSTIDFG